MSTDCHLHSSDHVQLCYKPHPPQPGTISFYVSEKKEQTICIWIKAQMPNQRVHVASFKLWKNCYRYHTWGTCTRGGRKVSTEGKTSPLPGSYIWFCHAKHLPEAWQKTSVSSWNEACNLTLSRHLLPQKHPSTRKTFWTLPCNYTGASVKQGRS